MIITTYEVYSIENRNGVEEAVINCLDKDRAIYRQKQATNGRFKKQFRTALPPYGVRIVEFDIDLRAKEQVLF